MIYQKVSKYLYFNMIYLNLIPSNMWYLNLRKILSKEMWENLSKKIREEQKFVCYCCKVNDSTLPRNKFHCHESWWFDDKNNVVSLKALICVCELCHKAIHLGRVNDKESFKRIMYINKWDYETTKIYVDYEFEMWSKRSNKQWNVEVNSFKDWLNEEEFLIVKNFFNNNN